MPTPTILSVGLICQEGPHKTSAQHTLPYLILQVLGGILAQQQQISHARGNQC